MCDINQYIIDIDSIIKNYRMNKGGVNHNHGNKFKLLPYITDESKQMTEFDGVTGAFSRMICGKELKDDFNADEFIQNVEDEIGEFEGLNSKEAFRNIIRTLFINSENQLINFDAKTLNYVSSTKDEKKFAKFLYSIFFDSDLKSLAKELYDKEVDNIVYTLALNALPPLQNQDNEEIEYKCYLPFIKELFLKDIKFIMKNEIFYSNSLKRLLEYYYMFYVSQLAMKLSQFEKADLNNPEKIYYSLSWESISKNRTSYEFGWELLNSKVNKLFSHAVTLELLNYHDLDYQFNYVELNEIFKSINNDKLEKQLDQLIDTYITSIKDVNWTEMEYDLYQCGNRCFDKVYKLFQSVDYQFIKSTRKTPYNKYKNKYVNFVYKNFGKRRGSLGYSLNLNEEDIILMTKICINNNNKLKLSLLFDEFEKRGMFFDRDSKIKIIQLYEKLNLLEKKSDSGDAQYVRSVL